MLSLVFAAFGLSMPIAVRRTPRRAEPVVLAAAATPVSDASRDWGGLPAAIQASKCGAINHQIVQQEEFEALLEYVSTKETELNSVNVATAIHRLAVQTKRDRAGRDKMLRDPRFVSLLQTATERAPQCNPQSLSNIMWGCATMQHWPPTMLKPMLSQIAVHLQSAAFEAQHLSLIVWALAVLQIKPTVLLDQIETQAITQLNDFNMQNCANIAWGFAKLNYKASGKLLPAVSEAVRAPHMLPQSKPVEAADLMFAVALLGDAQRDAQLIELLAGRASKEQVLDKFSSRQLVTMIWSFARLKMRPPGESFDQWLAILQEAHAARPLLLQDQRNLRRALEAMGEPTAWLDPPKPAADEDAAALEGTTAA